MVINNGFIIQKGRSSHTATRTDVTVTFPTAFVTTTYSVLSTCTVGTYSGDVSYGNIGARPVSTTQFLCWNERSQSYPAAFHWIAMGK